MNAPTKPKNNALSLIIIVIAFFGLQQLWWRYQENANAINQAIAPGQVVMYGTTWCGYCAKVRRYFDNNNVPFIEFDIEKSQWAHKEFKQLGGKAIPLIKIGNRLIHGYDLGAMHNALEEIAAASNNGETTHSTEIH